LPSPLRSWSCPYARVVSDRPSSGCCRSVRRSARSGRR
jgi:hypothetical protein